MLTDWKLRCSYKTLGFLPLYKCIQAELIWTPGYYYVNKFVLAMRKIQADESLLFSNSSFILHSTTGTCLDINKVQTETSCELNVAMTGNRLGSDPELEAFNLSAMQNTSSAEPI